MALVKCSECGASVSTKAQACPGCGARMPKKTSLVTKVAAIVLIPAVLMAVFNSGNNSGGVQNRTPLTAEQQAQKDKQDIELQRKKRLADAAIAAVKKSAKDPDSIKFSELSVSDDGVVCAEYRGKNSFGGMAVNYAVFPKNGNPVAGSQGDVATSWNKLCAKKSMTSMMWMF